jgi:Tol biopolymer transport system component
MLLSAPGQLVTWPELRDRLWDSGSEAEFEEHVRTAVAHLRSALADDEREPRFVETVERLGYRLIAPVTTAAGTGSSHPASEPAMPRGTAEVLPDLGPSMPPGATEVPPDVGRYELCERIGAGAMGEVYRARDHRLDRDVAVKFLPEWMAKDSLALHRFRREAYATASLNHPNVLAVHDLAVVDGAPCLVSELLVGGTLRAALSAAPLAVAEAVSFAQQILDGLAAAHGKGIVHRDLKPENIFLTRDGHVKILDFGLAKQVMTKDGSALDTTLTPTTRTGAVLGTLGYQSPEQARGEEVDVRTDLFAFGAVLYEMLTGRRPFHRQSEADTISAVLNEEPPPPSSLNPVVPLSCDAITAKALEKDRELRYQSAAEARADIRRVLRELGGGSTQTSVLRSYLAQPGRRRRRGRMAVAAGVVALAVAAAWLAVSSGDGIPSFVPVQVTRGTGLESQPAISPDGNLVAYTSDESGNEDIWLFDLRNRTARNLTDTKGSDRHASWASDGSSVYFVSDRDGVASIYQVPLLGGAATRVVENGDDVQVSPDGRHLAFARTVGGHDRIFVVPLANLADQRQVTTSADGNWDHRGPAWSPDSTSLCYMTNREFWVVGVDGGRAHRVLAQGDYDLDPAWSHDGTKLYFSSPRGGGQSLWRATIVESPWDSLIFWRRRGPRPVIGGVGPEQQPVVSSDGRRLGYTTLAEDTNVALVDLRAHTVATWGSTQNESFPALAPDGTRVYYVSRADPPSNQLWVVEVRDGAFAAKGRRLTSHAGSVSQPSCSPDGRWVAYHLVDSAAGTNKRSIWVVPASGGPPRQLTQGPDDVQPSWSPDGKALVYTSSAGRNAIWKLALNEGRAIGRPSPITSRPGDDGGSSWAPDGRLIAFLRRESGGATNVWLVNPDGSGERRLTTGIAPTAVAWDPNVPETLLVAAEWGDRPGIEVRRVSAVPGVQVPPLLQAPRIDDQVPLFSVSRDGRWLAYPAHILHGNIWLLDAKGRGRF